MTLCFACCCVASAARNTQQARLPTHDVETRVLWDARAVERSFCICLREATAGTLPHIDDIVTLWQGRCKALVTGARSRHTKSHVLQACTEAHIGALR